MSQPLCWQRLKRTPTHDRPRHCSKHHQPHVHTELPLAHSPNSVSLLNEYRRRPDLVCVWACARARACVFVNTKTRHTPCLISRRESFASEEVSTERLLLFCACVSWQALYRRALACTQSTQVVLQHATECRLPVTTAAPFAFTKLFFLRQTPDLSPTRLEVHDCWTTLTLLSQHGGLTPTWRRWP